MFQAISKFIEDLVPTLRWWDLLDIIAVAYIVYRLLLMIKGTRAGQVLVGLGFLFLMYWLSDRWEVRTLHSILGNIFDNLFIILLLLFQQDIRRVLSQVGQAPFFSSADHLRESQLMEELVKACVSLSNKKIGALLVIEREADVLDFVEAGTVIDSQLTKEMLTSIFLPVSPLHDGAVLIRKGRVHMAGCFLPLTLNPNVSKSIGTRHRAAVGLTEETDAVCIVISEENGQISLAVDGKIAHNLDSAQLRKSLLELV